MSAPRSPSGPGSGCRCVQRHGSGAGPWIKKTLWKDLGSCPEDGFLVNSGAAARWLGEQSTAGLERPLFPCSRDGREGEGGRPDHQPACRTEFDLSLPAHSVEPGKFIPESLLHTNCGASLKGGTF